MLGGDHAREHLQPAGPDHVVVEPAAEAAAAQLDHVQAPALGAELGRQLFEPDDAVDQALQVAIAAAGGVVVEEQHGTAATAEELLQGSI